MAAGEWLSVSEAAEELGLAESTIVRGIDAGRIEAVRFGESHKGTRIHRAALMPWLKGEFTQSQTRARAALLTRLREQRLVVERMEADLAQERRRLLEMIREVEIDGTAADDGRRLRVV